MSDATASDRPIRSMLHPTDFTESSELAFTHALRLALAAKSKLYVLHADPRDHEHIDWSAFPAVRRTLARWGFLPEGAEPAEVGQLGIQLAKISARHRDPVHAILRFLDDHRSDLIVLATHGREGLPRWLSGSVAEPVAREAGADTLFIAHGARGFVVPETGDVRLRNVLVPIDHRPAPDAAFDAASRLCRTLGAEDAALHAVYIGAAADRPAVPDRPAAPLTVTHSTRAGDIVNEILAAAAESEADLIVMATEGRQGFLDAVRGTTTERVLRHAPCPVLAVPAGLPD